jgi:hypothetical protein
MADLFNIPRTTNRVTRTGSAGAAADEGGGGGGGEGGAPGKVGAFITPQTLVTFPGASTVITVIWNLIGRVNAAWKDDEIVLFIIALIIGMLIYLLSDDKGDDAKSKVSSFIIALLNSFMLAAAALGIDVATGGGGTTGTPGGNG